MNGYGESIDDAPPKDGVVRILDVNDIESYDFSAHDCTLAEGYIYVDLPDRLNLLAPDAYQGLC